MSYPLWKANTEYSMGQIARIHTIGSQLDALWRAKAQISASAPKPSVDNPLWEKVGDIGAGRMKGGNRMVGGHCPTRAHLREEVDGSGRKKKRAPAQPGSGRHARAEIVKKVMREKGLKMIEASKYVKQHGLY